MSNPPSDPETDRVLGEAAGRIIQTIHCNDLKTVKERIDKSPGKRWVVFQCPGKIPKGGPSECSKHMTQQWGFDHGIQYLCTHISDSFARDGTVTQWCLVEAPEPETIVFIGQ